jgi:hypothetical protein
MTVVWTRWLAVALMAIGAGLAGLQLSVCLADEHRATSDRPGLVAATLEPDLMTGAEIDESEPSASPRLTY